MSSSYHPQSDGQTEVLNRCLEDYLRCFVSDEPRHWTRYLPWVEWSYNTAWHSSIRMAPFEAVYGRPPPSIPHYIQGHSTNPELDLTLAHRTTLLASLKANILRAQNRMVQQANKHRTDKTFEVGDYVLLKLQPYHQNSVVARSSQKLAKRYFGPYAITAKIGNVAYKLALPPDSLVHPVFHVSLLRAYSGPVPASTETPPDPRPTSLIPESILSVNRSGPTPMILIKSTEATWEPLSDFVKRYPNFDLEDKVNFEGEGNDATTEDQHPQQKASRRRTTKMPPHFKDYIM